MTAGTVISSGRRYKTAVIYNMDRIPACTVTRGTVAAYSEGLAIGAVRRYKAAVGIMTRGASVMRIRSCTIKSIVMTARTVGRCYLHQGAVIWRGRGMRRLPV